MSSRYSRIGLFLILKSFSYLNFKCICLAGFSWGCPRLREAYVPVSTCSSWTWGTTRAAHWHARLREHHSSGLWGPSQLLSGERVPGSTSQRGVGDARAAQLGARPGEQTFSCIGEHAHYGADIRGAVAHMDVHLQEAWTPQRDTGWAYKFENLNMKTSLKMKKKNLSGNI
jgi:hypothetical protein